MTDDLPRAVLEHLSNVLETCISSGDLEAHVALLMVARASGWDDVRSRLQVSTVALPALPRSADVALAGARVALGLQGAAPNLADALKRELARLPLPPAATVFDDERVLLGVAGGIGWAAPHLAPALSALTLAGSSFRSRVFAICALSLARGKELFDHAAVREVVAQLAASERHALPDSDRVVRFWAASRVPETSPARTKLLAEDARYLRGYLSRLPRLVPLDAALVLDAMTGSHPQEARMESTASEPTIGIVTALDEEAVAVQWAFAPTTTTTRRAQGRLRTFDVGIVEARDGGRHVVAHYCAGVGNTRAAGRAAALFEAFPTIKYVIMCGIAGAVPHPTKADDHVRLGDIIVSNDQGVVEFDFGKDEGAGRFTPRHRPRPPAAALLDAVAFLRREALAGKRGWAERLTAADAPRVARRPTTDELRSLDGRRVRHPDDPRRIADSPRVFAAPIASSNAVLKDPVKRDALRDQHGVKAVEMEAAGIAETTWDNEAGYLVVRSACDYCDSRKNDEWHPYAAYAAAAFSRGVVEVLPAGRSPNA